MLEKNRIEYKILGVIGSISINELGQCKVRVNGGQNFQISEVNLFGDNKKRNIWLYKDDKKEEARLISIEQEFEVAEKLVEIINTLCLSQSILTFTSYLERGKFEIIKVELNNE